MRTLNENTNSVVLLPGLYAACDIDIVCLILLNVLFTTIIAKIFLKTDNKITGLRFFGGPLGFPGFGSGMSCPNVSSVGFFPVSAILLRMSAIWSCIMFGLCLTSSAWILSHPVLLLSFSPFAALNTSNPVIGSVNFCGLMSGIGLVVSCLNIF